MKEISRVELYRNIKRLILEKNENKWTQEIIDESFVVDFINLLNMNIDLLENIERNFLAYGDLKQGTFDKSVFEKQFKENIMKLKRVSNESIKQINEFAIGIHEEKNEIYAFNSLLNLLNKISNKIIDIRKFNLIDKYKGRELNIRTTNNRVFLSHAFDDKLYTLCLFIYMLERGILLYVDWLFCDKLNSGIDIKRNLTKELTRSKQLLFLRTVNSEFSIRGSGNIRGWCSWELGSFYNISKTNKNSKYYIELYKRENQSSNNSQLDGMKPLRDIRSNMLV